MTADTVQQRFRNPSHQNRKAAILVISVSKVCKRCHHLKWEAWKEEPFVNNSELLLNIQGMRSEVPKIFQTLTVAPDLVVSLKTSCRKELLDVS